MKKPRKSVRTYEAISLLDHSVTLGAVEFLLCLRARMPVRWPSSRLDRWVRLGVAPLLRASKHVLVVGHLLHAALVRAAVLTSAGLILHDGGITVADDAKINQHDRYGSQDDKLSHGSLH
jgi:hypothetical protein